MKKLLFTLLACWLTLALFNCKKTDVDSPDQTTASCKLAQLDRGNGNKHTFEYNSAGYIVRWVIEFQGTTGTDKREVYEYSFTYNNDNQVTGASITVNGQKPTKITDWGVGDSVRFNWTNGRLAQVLDQLSGKTFLTTTVKYDGQGRIVSLRGDADPDWGAPFEKEFVFDAAGNVKVNVYDDGILVYYEDITIDPTTRSPESLQAAHGLPYDVFNIMPWRVNASQETKGYEVDKSGKSVLVSTVKSTSLLKNSTNIVTAQTLDDNGKKRVMNFTLTDCQ